MILLHLNPFIVYRPYIVSTFCNFSSTSNNSFNVLKILTISLLGKTFIVLLYLNSSFNKSSKDNIFRLNFNSNNEDINLLGEYFPESNDKILFIYFGFFVNNLRRIILSNLDSLIFCNCSNKLFNLVM